MRNDAGYKQHDSRHGFPEAEERKEAGSQKGGGDEAEKKAEFPFGFEIPVVGYHEEEITEKIKPNPESDGMGEETPDTSADADKLGDISERGRVNGFADAFLKLVRAGLFPLNSLHRLVSIIGMFVCNVIKKKIVKEFHFSDSYINLYILIAKFCGVKFFEAESLT